MLIASYGEVTTNFLVEVYNWQNTLLIMTVLDIIILISISIFVKECCTTKYTEVVLWKQLYYVAKENRKQNSIPTTIAFINMLMMVGTLAIQPIIVKILDGFWQGTMFNGAPIYSTEEYYKAMVIIPICLLIASLLGLFIKRQRNETE